MRLPNKNNLKHLFGKKNDEIQTPPVIYDYLDKQHHFDFDPCPLVKPEWDGLSLDWGKCNFVNPPFSEIKKWFEKGIQEKEKGNKSVFLMTARVSSKYWFDLVFPNASEIYFIEGAVQFPTFKRKFPVPLCVIVLDPKRENNNLKLIGDFVEKRVMKFCF